MLARIIFTVAVSAALLAVVLLATVVHPPKRPPPPATATSRTAPPAKMKMTLYLLPVYLPNRPPPAPASAAASAYTFRHRLLDNASRPVGTARGFALPPALTARAALSLFDIMLFTFDAGDDQMNGNTLAVGVAIASNRRRRRRRMAVAGGTGAFAFARGYAVLRTVEVVAADQWPAATYSLLQVDLHIDFK